MNTRIRVVLGGALVFIGVCGMLGLSFFYGVVLFSDTWPALSKTNEALRILFSIESGLLVLYASFTALCIPLFLCVCYGAELISGTPYLSRLQTGLLLFIWMFAVIFGFSMTILQVERLIERVAPFSENPATFDIKKDIPSTVLEAFRTTLKSEVLKNMGTPKEGFVPEMFLGTFPGLTPTDFEGVEASIGRYTVVGGTLTHVLDITKPVHSAATAITDSGLDTLLENISVRLGVDLAASGTLTEIMNALIKDTSDHIPAMPEDIFPPVPVTPPLKNEIPPMVACTQEAKICPDGSAVGRSGPHCEFAPCPNLQTPESVSHVCTKEEREKACTREYRPVCASVEVQCITAPCNPILETYSNGCSACAESRVRSYTDGACSL